MNRESRLERPLRESLAGWVPPVLDDNMISVNSISVNSISVNSIKVPSGDA